MPYLVDEKPKVQRFLSCLPYHIEDRIEYDNPKTLEESMRKVNFCYEQNHKKESMTSWKAKRNNKFEQKKKGFVPNQNFKNSNTRNFPSKIFQGNKSNSQTNPNCCCNCNFKMYPLVYLMYCTPMFISGCVYNVFESFHAPMFLSRGSIM